MIEPALPLNEKQRLNNLKTLRLLDTPIEERFERITRLVCATLNVPIAAISLLDATRQWFKSIQGLDVSETPRGIAFCSHTILEEVPLIVTDAQRDPRFNQNPLVTGAPNIRFYAGCPLTMADGTRIGTLCAIDRIPRELSQDQITVLQDLAAMVQLELTSIALTDAHQKLISDLKEAERDALIDKLSRLWNRAGGEKLLEREWKRAQREAHPISVAILDIDHFKKINDRYGHDIGDEVIRHLARKLLRKLKSYDIVCRWGGEEFVIVLPRCQSSDLFHVMERLNNAVRWSPVETPSGLINITASIGAYTAYPNRHHQIEDALKRADKALYAAKSRGRDRYVIDLATNYSVLNSNACKRFQRQKYEFACSI